MLKLLPVLLLTLLAPPAFAQEAAAAAINSGDTAWMLASTALVLIMTPGLAFFYGGMVRKKNAVSTLYQSIIALGVVGLAWLVAGFSLSFSGSGKYIGDTAHLLLAGVGAEPAAGSTIPYLLFMAFQMMFAIITPALMTGAFAERVSFKGWVLFLILWSLGVYAPVAHWVWSSSGWLFAKGTLDFAGGLVVHMTAGYSALIAAIVIGKRKDFGKPAKPYNIGMIVLGTALLWFGWFGFNAGSALAANGVAVQAFCNSFFAAAAAMLMWTYVDKVKDGKPTLMGGCIGIVAGLVAITPAAGFVATGSSVIIGLAAGLICNLAARIVKGKYGVDDTLDVFACHGVGGTLGVLATGLLATTAVNTAGADGLLNGGKTLFNANAVGALAVGAYSMIATYILLKVTNAITPLRISDKDETTGLDSTQHGESIEG